MKQLKLLISEVNEPYNKIVVSGYDLLYIDGYKFPCRTDQTKVDFLPLKSPQQFPGMVERLKENNVEFSDKEEKVAIETLKKINYYKLSIFTKLLDDEKTFTRLLQLYEFDIFLKQELTLLLREIENLFKANLTYYLVNNYETLSNTIENDEYIIQNDEKQNSAEFYLDYGIYESTNKEKIDKILSKFAENVVTKREKELYIKHHIERYGGHIPFWVLVEILTFGEIIHFYSFLSRRLRRKWRENFFKVEVIKESEIEWLKTLQFLRNDCAHDNRLYGRTFNFTPVIHKDDMVKVFGKEDTELSLLKRRKVASGEKKRYDDLHIAIEKSKKTLFSALIIMRYFIESSTKSTKDSWNTFLTKLENEIKENNIPLSRIGFRNNWKDVLII